MTFTRDAKEVPIAGRTFLVRQFTVADVRALLDSSRSGGALDAGGVDVLGDTFFEDIRLRDLAWMVKEDPAVFDDMTPGEIRALVGAVKEQNPDFFAWTARMSVAAAARSSLSTPPSAA